MHRLLLGFCRRWRTGASQINFSITSHAWAKDGVAHAPSSHPETAKRRYQGIESCGKETVAGSEEEKEAEEVGITLIKQVRATSCSR